MIGNQIIFLRYILMLMLLEEKEKNIFSFCRTVKDKIKLAPYIGVFKTFKYINITKFTLYPYNY